MIDPLCINYLCNLEKKSTIDCYFTSHKKGWIYGTTAELISFDELERAYKPVQEDLHREHVVTCFKQLEGFNNIMLETKGTIRRPDIYLSVDYQEDLDLLEQVLEHFHGLGQLHTFSQYELVELYDSGKLDIQNKHLHEGFGD